MGVTVPQMAFTNCPRESRLVIWSGGTTFETSAGRDAWIIVLPMPRQAKERQYGQRRPAPAANGSSMAATVVSSASRTVFLRPAFPHSTPVGIETSRNQTNAMNGSASARTVAFWKSARMRSIAVEMMPAGAPMMKKPERIGRRIQPLCLAVDMPPI